MHRLSWTTALSRLVSIVMMIIGALFQHQIISQQSASTFLSLCDELSKDIKREEAVTSVDIEREDPFLDETE